MRAIMMSIYPEWVEEILNGKKTVEVRKTRPKLDTPFKVYIYCTKGAFYAYYKHCKLEQYGKVVAEFTCDNIYMYKTYQDENIKGLFQGVIKENEETITAKEFHKQSCLTLEQILTYQPNGFLYGLHITDLKVYDEPKELSEFKKEKAPQSWYFIEEL